MEWIGYGFAILIGLILGLIGGGGSILSIPILVYFFNLGPVTASAYSLFIVGMTSLVGAIPKYRDHLVNFRTAFLFGIPSIVTIFCTRLWIVPAIPEIIFDAGYFLITKRFLLLGIFALLMILASFTMIRNPNHLAQEDHRFNYIYVIIEGLIIGFLTGLVGAGGGFLIIPGLVLLTGLPFKTAVGTSLLIIAINSLIGFLGDALYAEIDWTFLITITGLAVTGILVGHQLSGYVSPARLRYSFGWFVFVTGIYILIREMFFAG
jgi:uncharacterized protein